MAPVSSGDVHQMEEAQFSDLLARLNLMQASVSKSISFGLGGGLATFTAWMTGNHILFGFCMVMWVVGYLAGNWLDSFQRCEVLMYDLDTDAESAYRNVASSFDDLMLCRGKWHIDAGGRIDDLHNWKRNAGAAYLVDRRVTVFTYALPKIIKSNITPPSIRSGKETLYFLPDFLLVVHGSKVGAVAYSNLHVRHQISNFIEEGTVPSDTRILRHTWRYPNKNGGPDRRFRNNIQIPVCEYEAMHLTSPNGLNELLEVSRAGTVGPFAETLAHLTDADGNDRHAPALPQLGLA